MSKESKRKARARSFLFDAERCYFDAAVEGLSSSPGGAAAVGAYALLLWAGWFRPEPGVWPDSDRLFASAARMDVSEWLTLKPHVASCFDTTSRPGFWIQSGTVRTHRAQNRFVSRQKERGKAGAKGRWNPKRPNEKDGASNANALATPMAPAMLGDGLSSVLGSRRILESTPTPPLSHDLTAAREAALDAFAAHCDRTGNPDAATDARRRAERLRSLRESP